MKIVHVVRSHFNNGEEWIEDRWRGIPMTDAERWMRNEALLGELLAAHAGKFVDTVKLMEAWGWRPYVAETVRSRPRQLLLLAQGFSTTPTGKHPKRMAADVIDARWKWVLTPVRFMTDLAVAAQLYGLQTGLAWKRNDWYKKEVMRILAFPYHGQTEERRAALEMFVMMNKPGFDPCHLEVP